MDLAKSTVHLSTTRESEILSTMKDRSCHRINTLCNVHMLISSPIIKNGNM